MRSWKSAETAVLPTESDVIAARFLYEQAGIYEELLIEGIWSANLYKNLSIDNS